MSGDWIKVRSDLATSPKVVRISSALKADRFRTVGGLHAAWCLFDAHSEDGVLAGYSLSVLDDMIGWQGFSAAMVSVGWLFVDGENLVLPRFDTHNGQSAKRRAQEADRKRESRKSSASDADKLRTREEKRREEEDQEQEAIASSSPETTTPACPHEQIIAMYHELLPANPRMKVWNGGREASLRARWREDSKRQSLDYWRRFFVHVSESPFLTGRAHRSGERPFLPGLDWLVTAKNFAKVIEGRYASQEAA